MIAALLTLPSSLAAAQLPLYVCETDSHDAASLGLILCDATPTAALIERAQPENLQTRDGALVSDVDQESISAVAGLQTGDMIYRVGGVDVENAGEAVEALARVGATSDTVVNFLRGGRPYRIKLRRD